MFHSPCYFPDIRLIDLKVFSDHRGYFREVFREEDFFSTSFVQDNESLSCKRGTIRGLHFQRPPHAQIKLVHVVCGAIFDVVVDLRQNSSTFGKWMGYELSAENRCQLFIPVGFAHGFCTLVDDTVVCYKVSDYYAPDCDGGIVWSDPSIGVDWPLEGGEPILSDKDAALPALADLEVIF